MKKLLAARSGRIIFAVSGAALIALLCILFWLKPWEPPMPKSPLDVKAVGRSQSIYLSWKSSGDTNTDAYFIYLGGKYYKKCSKNATSVSIDNLIPGQKYLVGISAISKDKKLSERIVLPATPLPMKIDQQNPVKTASGNFTEYSAILSAGKAGAVVPGLQQGLVPQGLGYIPEKKWYIISYYSSNGKGSMLSLVDATTGKIVKAVGINDVGGTQYKGHAGGVAVSEKNVWIASDSYLRRIKLSDIYSAKNEENVTAADKISTSNNASFAMYSNGVIWSGEFYEAKDYPTDKSHELKAKDGMMHNAWITGFKLDPQTDTCSSAGSSAATPDYVISIPATVQGSAILSDGRIVLSESYGRGSDSRLETYKNVLANKNDTTVTINGKSVPLWILDGTCLTKKNTAFPMSEGLIERDGVVDIIFESGAATYRDSCKYPLGTLWEVNKSFF
jgi:hypothetical protein